MADEIITLDPVEVAAAGRTELALQPLNGTGPIMVREEGPDWGTAEIEAFMAQLQRGEAPIDFRFPLREVRIPLLVQSSGATTFAAARALIQKKVARFQQEDGWLKRTLADGRVVFLDIVNASLTQSGGMLPAQLSIDPTCDLVLQAIPDFYGAEVDLGDNVETTLPELVFTEAGVLGDYPGRCRIVVDEDQAQDQRGLIWGIRSRNYSSAATAALRYEAEALTPYTGTAIATRTGASGGASNNVLANTNLGTSWAPLMNTNLLAGTFLTHVGSYRVFARVYDPNVAVGIQVKLRLVWDVGDLVNPQENDPWTFPQHGNFYIADLGEIRLDKTTGTHRWQGQIQAKANTAGADVEIDKLYVVPIDEGSGILRAPIAYRSGLAAPSAQSSFDTESGVIAGDALATGGTWTGAGDADDFSVAASVATRTALSDVSIVTGRFITASTPTLTGSAVQVDAKVNTPANAAGNDLTAVIARYSSTSNHLIAGLSSSGSGEVRVWKTIAGTTTEIGYVVLPVPRAADTYYTIRLWVTPGGAWAVWCYPTAAPEADPVMTGIDSALATGGSLASGKVGIYDLHVNPSAQTRTYDNFLADAGPSPEAVAFASQSVSLTTDGHFREDSSGVAWGPVSWAEGDLPRIPPAGAEGRTAEFFLKLSRGDLDQLPDPGIDDISARAFVRPCWLLDPS